MVEDEFPGREARSILADGHEKVKFHWKTWNSALRTLFRTLFRTVSARATATLIV